MFRSNLRRIRPLRSVGLGQVRFYPALHQYKNRITTVENVRKITSAMKLMAASKMKVAQVRLEESARPFYESSARVNKGVEYQEVPKEELPEDAGNKHLLVLVNTDRGMCGAITMNASRHTLALAEQLRSEGESVEFCSYGSKGQDQVAANRLAHELSFVALETGQKPNTFTEVCYLADQLLLRKPDKITIVYNKFENMLKNDIDELHLVPPYVNATAAKWEETEFDDEAEVFQNLAEFQFAASMWSAVHENQASEHATRFTAMDGASTNAGELVDSLTLQFNKLRQAAITTELSEVVGGMAAIVDA